VNSALLGDYNVDNALIAMTILSVLGADDAAIAAAMGQVSSISGRFDVVRGTDVHGHRSTSPHPGRPAPAVGGRSRMMPRHGLSRCSVAAATATGQTPEMGLVASTYSDATIVTSDNPRSESPSRSLTPSCRASERLERRYATPIDEARYRGRSKSRAR